MPFAPISPAYSLVSTRLRRAAARLSAAVARPRLRLRSGGVRAGDRRGRRARTSRSSPRGAGSTVASTTHRSSSRGCARPTRSIAAHAAIGPDDVAKILFTSGSTGMPKGVINTHRMICSNQQMILQALPFLGEEPPVLVDWLPWHHTFGGNHNIGIVVYNGGSLYIDEGRPLPGAFDEIGAEPARDRADDLSQRPERLRRARARVPAATGDSAQTFFAARAGAVLRRRRPVAARRRRAAGDRRRGVRRAAGARHRARRHRDRADGDLPAVAERSASAIGLPVPGVEAKLAPVGREARGAHPRSERDARLLAPSDLTRAAFDDEGFYCMGDAVRLVDASDFGARGWSSTAASRRTSSCRPAHGSASGRCARGSSRTSRPTCATW